MTGRKQILKASGVLMILIVISRLLGFVREQAIAGKFGATGLTDTYVTAITPVTIITTIIGGAISSAFLPAFVDYLSRGKKEEGWNIARSVFFIITIGLVSITGLMILVAPLLVPRLVPQFNRQQVDLTVFLLRIIAPGILFISTALFFGAVLNSFKNFAIPVIASLLVNITVIIYLLMFGKTYGIEGLAAATVTGMFAQFVFLVPFIYRTGFKLSLKTDLFVPGALQVVKLIIPVFFIMLFAQIYQLTDKFFASGLAGGSITNLNYAFKMVNVPIGLFAMVISTVIFPTLSEKAAKKEYASLGRTLAFGFRLTVLVAAPVAVGLIVLREPLVELLFERGAFNKADTNATASALMYYSFGIIGAAGIAVYSKAFFALKEIGNLLKINIITAFLNIILAALLVRFMGHGGLALANSVAVTIGLVLSLIIITNKLGAESDRSINGFLVKIIISAVFMGLIIYLFLILTEPFSLLIRIAISGAVGSAAYLGLAKLFKIEEIELIFSKIKRYFH